MLIDEILAGREIETSEKRGINDPVIQFTGRHDDVRYVLNRNVFLEAKEAAEYDSRVLFTQKNPKS